MPTRVALKFKLILAPRVMMRRERDELNSIMHIPCRTRIVARCDAPTRQVVTTVNNIGSWSTRCYKMRVWMGSYTYIDVGEREWFRDATAPFHSPLLLERLMTPAANLNLCMTLVCMGTCMRMWCTSNILSSASCGNKVSTQALWKPWLFRGNQGFWIV